VLPLAGSRELLTAIFPFYSTRCLESRIYWRNFISRYKMGNANSSHSSRTPRSLHALDNDPSWSNIGGGGGGVISSSSYPRPRGVWQPQQQHQSEMMEERQQQQQQQHRSLITDYQTGQSGYDHFDQECVRELNNKMASDPGRFNR